MIYLKLLNLKNWRNEEGTYSNHLPRLSVLEHVQIMDNLSWLVWFILQLGHKIKIFTRAYQSIMRNEKISIFKKQYRIVKMCNKIMKGYNNWN